MYSQMNAGHDIDPRNHSRSIVINTGKISATDFDMTEENKEQLISAGRIAALTFFSKK
jgi:hypothetical protein